MVKLFKMDVNKLKDIIENAKHKSNKDLQLAKDELAIEFEKTKKLAIELTYHMQSVEDMFNIIDKEITKRMRPQWK